MIISMRLHASSEEIAEVTERIKEFGYKVHSIEGEERVENPCSVSTASMWAATNSS
jgi:hypothetical protein